MFFNTIYKFPIWNDLDKKSRYIRVLILGVILYVASYSFLNSNYVNNISFVQDYKHYLYYLIGVDLCTISTIVAFDDKVNKPKPKKIKLLKGNTQKAKLLSMLLKNKQQLLQKPNPPQYQQPVVPQYQQPIIPDIDIPVYGQNNIDVDIDIPVYN